MTRLDRTMIAGLWLAALAVSIMTLRSGGAPFAALAVAPLLGAALGTSLLPSRR